MNVGALVIYRNKSAVITAISSEKIELRLPGGENKNVRVKDIEFLHAGPVTSLPPVAPADPEWEEIWELIGEEKLSFAEFMELAYNLNTPEAAWAAWCELQRGIYFSGSVSMGVSGRTQAEISEKIAKLNEKNREQQERSALLERIRSKQLLESDKRFMREIEDVALGQSSSSRLLRDLGVEPVPEKAQQLLLRSRIWNYSNNPWPARLGVDITLPQKRLPAISEEPREDLTGMRALAIDDAGSNDPDDAISWDNGLLWVHIADPAAIAVLGDEIELEAVQRGSASYLPEGVVPMLPEKLISYCGLGLQSTSPAISFGIEVSADGDVELRKMMLSTICCERLTYECCAGKRNISPLPELRTALERFRLRRAAAGALFIKLPEVKIRLNFDGSPEIIPCPLTPERELVANAMLACGHAVAKYCAKLGICFPFINQDEPQGEERGETLPEMYSLRRRCPAGVTSLSPGRHYGLGLEPYSRVTSPLRRYSDLLAHYQLRRLILKQKPLDFDFMDSRLATAERMAAERRKLEKYANEYWLLVYLKQHPDLNAEAVLVDKNGDRQTWFIPQLAYEYKCRIQRQVALGTISNLHLTAAEPELMRSYFTM